MSDRDPVKGQGAQFNTHNPFLSVRYVKEHMEGLDEEETINPKTEFLTETPRKIVNKVTSPDIGHALSMNPYQGCEHGCIYCYARNSHQYWGYSAGVDFERKIIVKPNAPELLEKQLKSKSWKVSPIMLSGNTDCYQPIERKTKLTRRMLEVLLKHRHPVGIITKNALILRDLDLLTELNKHNLVHVNISLTTVDEDLRRRMEPRTASAKRRLEVVSTLTSNNIPVNVMVAPVIPGLNSHEIPELVKAAADHGAQSAAYIMVRLNGSIKDLFEDWVQQHFPDRAEKVLNQVRACHGGQLNDSRWGKRMKGDGPVAVSIANLFAVARRKHMAGRKMKPLNVSAFRNRGLDQLELF
ncbi:MAG: PA0069 family radical SAM protein [Flavobacteriales bacterium]|nr:PA0069 family radical SAM protein [Flavobacteriales bacterium]MCB9447257.1 PA0069 family radical SAM protein [Flavobacteriales bacterium]